MFKKLLKSLMRKPLILSNSADGTHADGRVSLSALTAISSKYLFGKTTAVQGQIALAGSGNTSTGARAIGVITDEADAAGDTVAVELIGAAGGTQKALANGTISIGDLITSDVNSMAVSFASVASGTYYIYGIAITSAVAGDRVEFVPTPGITQTK